MMMVDNPRMLALDTSSQVSSVALCQGERLVAESALHLRSTHSQSLLAQIDDLLRAAGWGPADLDLLAVVTGPGAFTGVRIGVATVKGLAQVLNLPVVSVSSLTAVAMNLPLLRRPVCVFVDARKKEVYTQLFQLHDGFPRPLNQARVIAPHEALADLPLDSCFVGDGVAVYYHLILQHGFEPSARAPACCHPIQASRVAALALQDYFKGLAQRPEQVVPTYIRPSDAELNRQTNNVC
ncbi:tRNA (adenosine(37)-N6)-threonylcarbamoyltransferase complex dimerization subunit type 1 TsaB [Pelovirga terrestris]|uniref:tRNA (Adenosine(37)-N6)-threonylcarbamoyltransferase complex dimerization subunit type 1 TsaB n=1 Tax=Pelovirga terrestris TaxID=2771352 RepID=A0A8J6UPV8_9BACT|nr:tRNA (adenosine(37)-N6)-threonylcarbamoyltransferase complex dimerization subunit type 1 TsaB [Pelovirga terrestris]MBD1400949.1 tRNA (adenosine(37)-N6)-threonylcarbamoyltransferase complex dimerization subunit type 1 TsaB [Pelovirga terrestris]